MCSAGEINVFCCDVVVLQLMCSAGILLKNYVLKLMVPICVLCSEILFRCRNWASCSEFIFAADLCVVQRNSVSLPQLNLLQRNYVSLPKPNLLQRIDIRCRFVCCAAKFYFAAVTEPLAAKFCFAAATEPLTAKLCFATETEPPTANWYSLPICVLCSEILFRCRNWTSCQRNYVRYRNWTSCSELIFATELCVVQRNCGANNDAVFAAELAACGEPILAAELGSPQWTSSRCRFLQ